jgi:hypothetical protein
VDVVHDIERIKPAADIAIESAEQVRPGMEVLANWNPDKPDKVGFWYQARVLTVDSMAVQVEIRRQLPKKGSKKRPQESVDRITIPFKGRPEDCRLFLFETFAFTASDASSEHSQTASMAGVIDSKPSEEPVEAVKVETTSTQSGGGGVMGIFSKLFALN